ncbi:MAG TPA: response regulator [Ignavibacteriaceae bacterium]|nr:response regulator [Ignavibacteriaceae bacterium]
MSEPEKKSILVIDDDKTIRKLIHHHLKLNNFIPFEAEDSNQAFEILKKEKIDLVLSDVTMEGMDGFAFCQKVRENEKHRFLPFIFVTAKNTLEDKSKAIESGGDDIITKPFDINELILKTQALIRRSDIYRTYGIRKSLEKSFDEIPAKVLFVDDDPSMAKLFKYNLDKAGFDCRLASSVDEAMQKIKKDQPDIIVSDIMMPKTDGFEFRRMLLKDHSLKDIPFIFLTAKNTEEDILVGYDLGITDYVVKTAGPKLVVAKVSAVIKSLGNERKKIISELQEATSSLRAKVVPDNFPEFEGFGISHLHIPFRGIPGGDFIDYYKLDENNLVVILGDVMGKKWGAWYFAYAYAGYIRSALRGVLQSQNEFSPSEILEQVNSTVYGDTKVSEVFATLSIIIINNLTNELKYSGAGDIPIIYNPANGEIQRIKSKGLLLGFSKKGDYEDAVINLKKNDRIYLTTDGLIDSRAKTRESFGEHRLFQLIKDLEKNKNPLEVIKQKFDEFTDSEYDDDISLILIEAN